MLIVSAIAVLILAIHAVKIVLDHKLAGAFALGIDFGKAIEAMTPETKAAIVAEVFPQGIPQPRDRTP